MDGDIGGFPHPKTKEKNAADKICLPFFFMRWTKDSFRVLFRSLRLTYVGTLRLMIEKNPRNLPVPSGDIGGFASVKTEKNAHRAYFGTGSKRQKDIKVSFHGLSQKRSRSTSVQLRLFWRKIPAIYPSRTGISRCFPSVKGDVSTPLRSAQHDGKEKPLNMTGEKNRST